MIEAETPNGRAGAGPIAWGRRAAVIGGGDVVDADVPMQATSSVSGRVTLLDGPTTVPDGLTVAMTVADPLIMPTGTEGQAILLAPVDPDGRFAFAGLRPGEYLFVERSSVPGWVLATADVGGQDGADQPFTVNGDVQTPDVKVTLSHASATVRGTVRTATGDPAEDATVLLFSTEPQFWHPLARRVLSIHVGAQGMFAFTPVPPGDYYLAATEPDARSRDVHRSSGGRRGDESPDPREHGTNGLLGSDAAHSLTGDDMALSPTRLRLSVSVAIVTVVLGAIYWVGRYPVQRRRPGGRPALARRSWAGECIGPRIG